MAVAVLGTVVGGEWLYGRPFSIFYLVFQLIGGGYFGGGSGGVQPYGHPGYKSESVLQVVPSFTETG